MNNLTNKTHILDLKIPYDEYSLFLANRVDNQNKYRDLAKQLSVKKDTQLRWVL